MRSNATIIVDGAAFGTRAWNQYFEPIVERCQDVNPAWDAVRAAFFAIEEELFDAEGRTEEHSRWAPLSEDYADWKAGVAPDKGILRLSDRLLEELTGEGPYGESRSRQSWEYRTMATVQEQTESGGVEEMYLATVHMTGLPRRRPGPMPARPPVRLTKNDKYVLAQPLINYVITGDAERSPGE